MIALRSYQTAGLAEIRGAYASGSRSVLYVAPTGSGKTTVFAHIARTMLGRGRRVLIVVHRRELLGQASRRLADLGVPHGRVAPGWPWGGEAVQVASVRSLVLRLARLARWGWYPDLVILDEAHHVTPGSTWGAVLDHFDGVRVLGVTATPTRLDGRGLGRALGGYFDALVMGPSVAELTALGYLAPVELHVPGRLVDAAGVPVRGGDYARAELAAVSNRPEITGDAIAHYRALGGGRPALAFCASVEHARDVAAAFAAAGLRAESIDGGLSEQERSRRLGDLAEGRLQVLTSCDLLVEGVDVPAAEVGIFLRRTLSLTVHLQQIGRLLRPAPGKRCAVLLDHVGNMQRLGPPGADRGWSLSGVADPVGAAAEAPAEPARRRARVTRQAPALVPGHLVAAEVGADGVLSATPRQLAWDLAALRSVEAQAGYTPGWADTIHRALAA